MVHPVIEVVGLSKQYKVAHARRHHRTFYDLLSDSIRRPFRRKSESTAQLAGDSEDFWALRDIAFSVQPGEVVGVIGRNGAGKSTLLKVLSRITPPTTGRISVKGRFASLLEVGTGFHPELSGRENIYLNGAILGMSRKEVNSKLDEIVDFSEVGKFLDTPVKRYSSGMYVRLAFSVAASLDTDILVIDEVLAVGDSAFQEKCMSRMGNLSSGQGRTILFVSHNLAAVSKLCTRALVLNAGSVECDGNVADGLSAYARLTQGSSGISKSEYEGPLKGKAELDSVLLNNDNERIGKSFSPATEINISVLGLLHVALEEFRVTLRLFKGDQCVLGMHDSESPSNMKSCRFTSIFNVPPFFLSPGLYSIEVNMYSNRTGEWMVAKNLATFAVTSEWYSLYEPTHAMGIVNIRQAGQRCIDE